MHKVSLKKARMENKMSDPNFDDFEEKYGVVDGEAFFYFCKNLHINTENIEPHHVDEFNENFLGTYPNAKDFAFSYAEDTHGLTEFTAMYFDTDQFLYDLQAGGDIWIEDLHDKVFVYHNY